MIFVMTTPFAVNAQDLLTEDRHMALCARECETVEEAVAWINDQRHPIDFYYIEGGVDELRPVDASV